MFRKYSFLLLVLVLVPFSGKSQDSTIYSIGTDIGYHPQDFYFHIRGQLIRQNLSHEVFLGFGITNTILQGQLKPNVGYDFSYRFKLTPWLSISPLIRLSYSILNTRAPSHPMIHLTEGFGACRLAIGKRHRIAVSGGVGPGVEWKYNAYSTKMDHFQMWNYFAEIGYYYEL